MDNYVIPGDYESKNTPVKLPRVRIKDLVPGCYYLWDNSFSGGTYMIVQLTDDGDELMGDFGSWKLNDKLKGALYGPFTFDKSKRGWYV